MDTRGKIVTWAEAGQRMPHMSFIVSAWFDPMLAQHAAWMDEIPEQFRVVVQLLDPPDPLLPARARAELAAALARVELVILDSGGAVEPTLRLEEHERELRRAFLEHVRERQQ